MTRAAGSCTTSNLDDSMRQAVEAGWAIRRALGACRAGHSRPDSLRFGSRSDRAAYAAASAGHLTAGPDSTESAPIIALMRFMNPARRRLATSCVARSISMPR